MFRIKTRLGLAATAATAAVTLVPAAAQAKPKCKPAGSRTIVQNGYARVYTKGGKAIVCIKANGRKTQLAGATPSDQFALGGHYVGWSSSTDPNNIDGTILVPHSVMTVMRISDRNVDSYRYPFETNEHIDRIVVASDGAAAWSMTPSPADGNYTTVQGTDRKGHPEDNLSNDHADVIGSSLRIHGKTVTWSYVDAKTGSATLF